MALAFFHSVKYIYSVNEQELKSNNKVVVGFGVFTVLDFTFGANTLLSPCIYVNSISKYG